MSIHMWYLRRDKFFPKIAFEFCSMYDYANFSKFENKRRFSNANPNTLVVSKQLGAISWFKRCLDLRVKNREMGKCHIIIADNLCNTF